jgi:hypothetical protein
LSGDNCSVASAAGHLPVQNLLTFYSPFQDLEMHSSGALRRKCSAGGCRQVFDDLLVIGGLPLISEGSGKNTLAGCRNGDQGERRLAIGRQETWPAIEAGEWIRYACVRIELPGDTAGGIDKTRVRQ